MVNSFSTTKLSEVSFLNFTIFGNDGQFKRNVNILNNATEHNINTSRLLNYLHMKIMNIMIFAWCSEIEQIMLICFVF